MLELPNFGHMTTSCIIIQTHIRNTNSYSDANSEKLHISLIKYRKELPTAKLLTKKQVFKNPLFCR